MCLKAIVCLTVLVLSVVSAFVIPGTKTTKYTYYPREAWGALNGTDTRPLRTPAPFVVLHHTYIPAACHSFQECSQAMRSMQKYHMSLQWGDIGYNFCVGADGAAYEGRGWRIVGIHAGPANSYSVGICIIGDWREELPPASSLVTAKALISEGVDLGIISPSYKLIGHMQAMSTECPGRALLDYISTWPHYLSGHVNFHNMTVPSSS